MNIINFCDKKEEVKKLYEFVESLENNQEYFEFKTSGSTGTPKTMFFSRNQIYISTQQTIDFFELTDNDVLLCPFSMEYVAAKMMVSRAFFLNATLVFVGPNSHPLATCFNQSVSFAAMVPLQLQNTLGIKEETMLLNNIEHTIIGGAPIAKTLEKKLLESVTSPLYQSYGMTETLSHIAFRKRTGSDKSEWYKALPQVAIKKDVDGTLMVKSAVTKVWLKTNDLVEIERTKFKWLGRKDLVINSGAYKIHIEHLEDRLNAEFTNNQLYISIIQSEKYGSEPLLMVYGEFDKTKFLSWSKSYLHPYEIPKNMIELKEIPLLQNGKIDRQSLAEITVAAQLQDEIQSLRNPH